MIKELICSKINSYISSVFNKIDENDLELSLLNGTIKLQNLRLSDQFLESCQSSFGLTDFQIHSFYLNIPWYDSQTSPIVIQLDDIDVHLKWNSLIYNMSNENSHSFELSSLSSLFQSFSSLGKDISISIHHIHIILDDDSIEKPFSTIHCTIDGIISNPSLSSNHNCDNTFAFHHIALMNGFSIFFDNTNKIMKDLSASIDYSIDLRKERYYSLNSILSNLSNTIDQTDLQTVSNYLTQNYEHLLISSSTFHSIDDLQSILSNELTTTLSNPNTLTILSTHLYSAIKTIPPFLSISITVEEFHVSLNTVMIPPLTQYLSKIPIQSSELSSSSSTQEVRFPSTEPSSFSFMPIITILFLLLWLFFSFVQALGSVLAIGTGLLYYRRFMSSSQEKKIVIHDEERKKQSSQVQLSIDLKGVDLLLEKNDMKESILCKGIHSSFDFKSDTKDITIHCSSCSSSFLQFQDTNPCLTIHYREEENYQCTIHLSSLSLQTPPLWLYQLFYIKNDQPLEKTLNPLNCITISLDQVKFSISHFISIISSVRINVRSSGIVCTFDSIAISSNLSHSQICEFHTIEISNEKKEDNDLHFIHCSISSFQYNCLHNHFISSTNQSNMNLLSYLQAIPSYYYFYFTFSIQQSSLLLPNHMELQLPYLTISYLPSNNPFNAISFASSSCSLSYLPLSNETPFTLFYTSQLTGSFHFTSLLDQSNSFASRLSFHMDDSFISLYSKTVKDCQVCLDTLLQLFSSSNLSLITEVNDTDDLSCQSSFILDLSSSTCHLLFLPELIQLHCQPSDFYQQSKNKALTEASIHQFACIYKNDNINTDIICTVGSLSLLSILSIEMKEEYALSIHYQNTNHSFHHTLSCDIGKTRCIVSSSLSIIPSLLSFFTVISKHPSEVITTDSIIQQYQNYQITCQISSLTFVFENVEVSLDLLVHYEKEGLAVKTFEISSSQILLDHYLSCSIKCQRMNNQLLIEIYPFNFLLTSRSLDSLLQINSSIQSLSFSSSPSSMSTDYFSFPIILSIPHLQVFLVSTKEKGQVPISCIEWKSIHFEYKQQEKKQYINGSFSLSSQFYRREIDLWENVIDPWELQCEFIKEEKNLGITINAPTVFNLTVSNLFLQDSIAYWNEINESFNHPIEESIEDNSTKYIHFINQTGISLQIHLYQDKQYQSCPCLESFTLNHNETYCSKQLAFPSFESKWYGKDSYPFSLHVECISSLYPSLSFNLPTEDTWFCEFNSNQLLIAKSQLVNGKKTVCFSSALSIVNASSFPLFYALLSTTKSHNIEWKELTMNEEVFIPVTAYQYDLVLSRNKEMNNRVSLLSIMHTSYSLVYSFGKKDMSLVLHPKMTSLKSNKSSITIEILPFLTIQNSLPCTISCSFLESLDDLSQSKLLEQKSILKCEQWIPSCIPYDMSTILFTFTIDCNENKSVTTELDHYYSSILSWGDNSIRFKYHELANGQRMIELSCDYCIFNHSFSDLLLSTKKGHSNPFIPINVNCPDSIPLLLSLEKSKESKQQTVYFTMEGKNWSNKVSLDLILMDGCFNIHNKDEKICYSYAYSLSYASPSLTTTKVLTIISKYLLSNHTSHIFKIQSDSLPEHSITILPFQTVELNWLSSSKDDKEIQVKDCSWNSSWSPSIALIAEEQFIQIQNKDNEEETLFIHNEIQSGQFHFILSFADEQQEDALFSVNSEVNSSSLASSFISINLAGIGISLIQSNEYELLYCLFHSIGLQVYSSSTDNTIIEMEVNCIQVDTNVPGLHFPILIGSNSHSSSLTFDSFLNGNNQIQIEQSDPSLILSIHYTSTPSLLTISDCEIVVNPLQVMIDSYFIYSFSQFIYSLPSIKTSHSSSPLHYYSSSRLIHIEQLLLYPIHINLSIFSSLQYPFANIFFNHPYTPALIQMIGSIIGHTVMNINNVPMKMDSFKKNDCTFIERDFLPLLYYHFYHQVTRKLVQLLGSMNLLGNPIEFVSNVNRGFQSFIQESSKGAKEGPVQFINGLGKGTKNLMKKTTYGLLNSVERMTSALGDTVEGLTFSKEYSDDRENGKTGLIHGVHTGVSDFVKNLTSGSIGDVGKGVVGMFTKPLGGLLDDTTHVLDRMKTLANKEEKPEKVRIPRFVNPGGLLIPYSLYLSNGTLYFHSLLHSLNLSYICHLPINNRSCLLLFTEKEILITNNNGSKLLWRCSYDYLILSLHQGYLVMNNQQSSFSCFIHSTLICNLIYYYLLLFSSSFSNQLLTQFIIRLLYCLDSIPYVTPIHYHFITNPQLAWLSIESIHLLSYNTLSKKSYWKVKGCGYTWKSLLNEKDIRKVHEVLFSSILQPIGLTQCIEFGGRLDLVIKEIDGVFKNYKIMLLLKEIDSVFKKDVIGFVKC